MESDSSDPLLERHVNQLIKLFGETPNIQSNTNFQNRARSLKSYEQVPGLIAHKLYASFIAYSYLQMGEEFQRVFNCFKLICCLDRIDLKKEKQSIDKIEMLLEKDCLIPPLIFTLEIMLEIITATHNIQQLNLSEEEEAVMLDERIDAFYKRFLKCLPELVEKAQPDYFKLCLYVYRCAPYDLALHKIELLACSEKERRSKLQTD